MQKIAQRPDTIKCAEADTDDCATYHKNYRTEAAYRGLPRGWIQLSV
jgi:hypothetical protein